MSTRTRDDVTDAAQRVLSAAIDAGLAQPGASLAVQRGNRNQGSAWGITVDDDGKRTRPTFIPRFTHRQGPAEVCAVLEGVAAALEAVTYEQRRAARAHRTK